MSFILREVKHQDLQQLSDLAKQFTLLNLPGEKKVLQKKIDVSIQSFSGKLPKDQAKYIFVIEDTEEELIVGSSMAMGKHGTDTIPHFYYKILKKNHYSDDLGLGFIHQLLRFQADTDGPSEIGGLLVDKLYRRRPEKLGKQISLIRFCYMGMHPDRFEDEVLCELTPPLTDDGRSEFWEALGRRFTGLSYQEADLLSQSHKEFIRSLFPEADIYLSLLEGKARLVLGRVGEQTKPAQHLLESIGFKYMEEVDPFDGGPHFGAKIQNILTVKNGRLVTLASFPHPVYRDQGLMCSFRSPFRAALVSFDLSDDKIVIPEKYRETLGLDIGEQVYLSPLSNLTSNTQLSSRNNSPSPKKPTHPNTNGN